MKSKDKNTPQIREGDVIILKKPTKCAFWKLAIIESLIVGPDGVARAAIVKVTNSEGRPKCLRRSVKHLFPLESQQLVILQLTENMKLWMLLNVQG